MMRQDLSSGPTGRQTGSQQPGHQLGHQPTGPGPGREPAPGPYRPPDVDRSRGVLNAVDPAQVQDPPFVPDALARPTVVVHVLWADQSTSQVRGFAHAWTRQHVRVHLVTGHLVWFSARDLRRADALD